MNTNPTPNPDKIPTNDIVKTSIPTRKVKDVLINPVRIPKPILKWVGGKTQILDRLVPEFPVEMNNYIEPFLGGGSVLISLLTYVKEGIIKVNGNIYAYDLNEPLIHVYKNIQTNHTELYNAVQSVVAELIGCGNGSVNRKPENIEEAVTSKENYYYWTRSVYNALSSTEKTSVYGSALFIFLNKTCFRGLFRIGPNGFNSPYGHYTTPEIVNRHHLDEIHELIQPVVFSCGSFAVSLTTAEPDDFVYLDPPYAPDNPKSFVGYANDGFGIELHTQLFNMVHSLTDSKIKIMMSNADVELVRNSFTSDKYTTTSIICRRSINSKNPEAKAKEVIVANY